MVRLSDDHSLGAENAFSFSWTEAVAVFWLASFNVLIDPPAFRWQHAMYQLLSGTPIYLRYRFPIVGAYVALTIAKSHDLFVVK